MFNSSHNGSFYVEVWRLHFPQNIDARCSAIQELLTVSMGTLLEYGIILEYDIV